MFAFEMLTGAELLDCFELGDNVVFVVKQGQLGLALGKNKNRVLKIAKTINRNIKIVEYKPNPVDFVKSLLMPLKVRVVLEDSTVKVEVSNPKIKGIIIGRNKEKLRIYQQVLDMHFKGFKLVVI